MNERGEMNLLFVVMIVGLTGVMFLGALRLQRSFSLLQKRTHLFLCAKETEGELKNYMTFMGRTNWAIGNINKAKWVMAFIPGLQGAALDAEKLRRLLKHTQNLALVPYVKKITQLKARGCPMDPRLAITPFRLTVSGYVRDSHGRARLRKEKWTNYYADLPYLLSVDWDASQYEAVWPRFRRISSENGARRLSASFSF